VIAVVSAVDMDIGSNGQLSYALTDLTEGYEDRPQLFRIDAHNGTLFVASDLLQFEQVILLLLKFEPKILPKLKFEQKISYFI